MKILFVCLGNICRSPTAEGVVRHIAHTEAPDLHLELDSAGTADYHIGSPPDKRSCAHAARRGYDITGLRARQVQARDFHQFDLILAMDEANLRDLQAMAPANSRARLALFLDFVPGRRGQAVPDPYYGGEPHFEEVLDLVEEAARGLIRAIRLGEVGAGEADRAFSPRA